MELKNVSVAYKKEQIYNDLNIKFDQVGITFVKGDSGEGKSTLLNVLYGIKHFKGDYIIPEKVTKFRRNNMAYIFQDFKIQTDLTVYENIILHLQIKDIEVDEDRIDELLDSVSMKHNKYKPSAVLSGGEKQRLAIVRALITDPSVLLCDEPTGNLDEETSFEIFDILKEISKTKLVIVASHSELLIEKYADRLYVIKDKDIQVVKQTDQNKLVIGGNKYGVMTNGNIVKLAFQNFWRYAFKISTIFLAFAIFTSVFLILNFSKNSFDRSLNEKYVDYKSRDTFVTDVFGYSSIDELDKLAEEFGYDNYIIDLVYNPYYNSGLAKGLNIWGGLPYTGDRFFRLYDERLQLSQEQINELSYPYRRLHNYDETFADYEQIGFGTMFAFKDISVIEEHIIVGSLPKNDYEVLINEFAFESIISEYNEHITKYELDFETIVYEDMTSEDKMAFIERYQLGIGFDGYLYLGKFDIRTLQSFDIKVVGIVDDITFTFDNYPYNMEPDSSFASRKHNKNIYSTIGHIEKNFQLLSNNFTPKRPRDYYSSEGTYQLLDAVEILSKEVDFSKKEIYKTFTLYDGQIDSREYLEKVDLISKHDKILEVKLPEYFYDISEDVSNKENVDSYIATYSFYVLLIGLLTALTGFIRFNLKRQSEYQVYELLGMEELEKRKLYYVELILINVNFIFLTIIAYFGMTMMLSNVIERTISTLIYRSRSFDFAYIPDMTSIGIVLSLFIPFVACYLIQKRKLIK